MFSIILGNIFSVGAMISDAVSGTKKSSKDILMVQTVSQVFYALSAFVLKGYSAVVQNFVSIFRNIAAIKQVKSRTLTVFLIVLPVVLGIIFNNRGIIGLLPVAANLEYSIAVFKFGEDKDKLKLSFFLNVCLFAIFNFSILNFVGGGSNLFVVASLIIGYIKNRKDKKTEE